MMMHQLTPNAFVQSKLYFWLAKAYCFEPSVETFAHMYKVHHQLKCIQGADSSEGEAQYGCYNFTYQTRDSVQEQVASGLGFVLVLSQGSLQLREWYSPSRDEGD